MSDCFYRIEQNMSHCQGKRFYFLLFSMVCLAYDLELQGLLEGNIVWLSGYKVIFFVAAVRSLTSYLCLDLNTLLERTRQLQYSTLATTCKGEVLALYREAKHCPTASNGAKEHHSMRAFGHGEQTQFTPHDKQRAAPVFWCSLMTVMVLYNTAHLALVPLSYTSPLLFGTPAFALYWGAMGIPWIVMR